MESISFKKNEADKRFGVDFGYWTGNCLTGKNNGKCKEISMEVKDYKIKRAG